MNGDATVTVAEEVSTVTILEDNTTVSIAEDIVEVVTVGIQGPAGPPGSSGDANFTQSFTSQSSVTVTHNLAKYPSVTVLDSAGDEVEGLVDHLSTNQLTLTFSAPFTGIAICN